MMCYIICALERIFSLLVDTYNIQAILQIEFYDLDLGGRKPYRKNPL